MKKNSNGFSLIEVIIATSILSIAVFGVYKLIGENSKIINNSGNLTQVNYLLKNTQECIENIGFDSYTKTIGQEYFFNFGENLNKCNLGIDQKIIIDNLEYQAKGTINDFGVNYIDWLISISSETSRAFTGIYKQIKK